MFGVGQEFAPLETSPALALVANFCHRQTLVVVCLNRIRMGYSKNSFRMSDLNCRTVRRKPSFCPRARDHPVGFGYRNYSAANRAEGHDAACSQFTVEVVIKITSVELSQRI